MKHFDFRFDSFRCTAVLAALLLSCLTAMAGSALASELLVIVSAKSGVTALNRQQVTDIFLGKLLHFPDGSEAVALDHGLGSPIRNAFYSRVAGKSPELVKAYWAKMIFTGRGQPPREAGSNAAVRRMVAETPGLISYIDKSALDASVKTVLVLP